ncbi:hypothetical protein BHM03_00013427 [Ensete ventricosum]|nr:hypothetical protein BHM03_00013427 [Ensete ventricosum]
MKKIASKSNFRGFGGGDINTTKSTPYDGGVSSRNDGCSVSTPRKHMELSRRTFRQSKSQDSTDTDTHKEERMNKMTTAHEQLQNELYVRDRCVESQDFHSVQSWLEAADDEPVKSSLSSDAEFHSSFPDDRNGSPSDELHMLVQDRMEIRREAEALREEEVSEMFDRSDERHGRFHLREEKLPPRAKNVPRLPHVACLHCRHGECHQTSVKPTTKCCCCHNARVEHEEAGSRRRMKRHCRPVLGGAPFVVCNNCLQLLQLPLDFFAARRRLCKLQCGACSKMLMFSFKARNRRVSFVRADASLGHEISNSPSNGGSQWDSLSCSEDNGISYSTDVERNDKLPPCLQLHQLMGYGSATEFLCRHSDDMEEELEATEPSTPHRSSPEEEEAFAGDGMEETAIEGDESTGRLRTREPPLHGLLKIMKLKIHKTGRKTSD